MGPGGSRKKGNQFGCADFKYDICFAVTCKITYLWGFVCERGRMMPATLMRQLFEVLEYFDRSKLRLGHLLSKLCMSVL
jgi:hypothetical protein